MSKIAGAAMRAKHEHHARTIAVEVRRGRDVLVRKIAPHLRVVREDGQPPRVEPLREVRAAFDGPSLHRVADWPKGAA